MHTVRDKIRTADNRIKIRQAIFYLDHIFYRNMRSRPSVKQGSYSGEKKTLPTSENSVSSEAVQTTNKGKVNKFGVMRKLCADSAMERGIAKKDGSTKIVGQVSSTAVA